MRNICQTVLWGFLAVSFGQVTLPAQVILVSGPATGSSAGREGQVQAAEVFKKALAYLEQIPLARKIIARLHRSATEYKVQILAADKPGIDPKPPEFDPTHNLIWWDPRAGLEWRSGGSTRQAHSAAVALMHELGHAYHKDLDARDYWTKVKKKTGDQWGNAEEKRTILQIENPVAKGLGEPERYFHEDNGSYHVHHYYATSPVTTLHASVRRPLFDALF